MQECRERGRKGWQMKCSLVEGGEGDSEEAEFKR
jgi:hypothetical protein